VEYLDKIKEVLEVIHKNEELEKLSITFQYKHADTEMEEFMLKIAIMVEQFNSSRK
jgi:septum formation topological specificity factor MinE